MADQKLTALSEISVPALEDLFYVVDDPAGTPVSNKITGYRMGGLLTPQACQGRLTTESNVPVSSSNRASQGTLYWTPCSPSGAATASGLVGFFDGTRYVVRSLTQLSLDLSTAEAGGAIDVGENYDVFIDYAAGTPALVLGPAWTNDTTRATALTTQGPLVVLTGDTDWRWVGTIRASGSGVTEDSDTSRYVANAHHRVPRPMKKGSTASHSYAGSNSARQWDGSTANQVNFVDGLLGTVDIGFNADITSVNGYAVVSPALDSVVTAGELAPVGPITLLARCFWGAGVPGVPYAAGYHYVAMLERSDASQTFDGFNLYVEVTL